MIGVIGTTAVVMAGVIGVVWLAETVIHAITNGDNEGEE